MKEKNTPRQAGRDLYRRMVGKAKKILPQKKVSLEFKIAAIFTTTIFGVFLGAMYSDRVLQAVIAVFLVTIIVTVFSAIFGVIYYAVKDFRQSR